LRNVRYASNTDRIDASQQNVVPCRNPTHAVQQKDILTESVERDVSLLDNGLPFFRFGCEQSG
jgi:hypothetical protein